MDTIADMLTQIRNAQAVHHDICTVPFSRIKEEIVKILQSEHYVREHTVEERDGRKYIQITLGYDKDHAPIIHSIARKSKPGRRIYRGSSKLPHVLSNIGCAIVSTSKGLMTDKKAREEGIGGEVICEVW